MRQRHNNKNEWLALYGFVLSNTLNPQSKTRKIKDNQINHESFILRKPI